MLSAEDFANKIDFWTKKITGDTINDNDRLNLFVEIDTILESLDENELTKEYWM